MARRKTRKTTRARGSSARATSRPSVKAAASTSRVPVAKTYKLYIDGKFPRSESGRYYPLQNGGSTVLANVCRSSRKDFREAVVAARTALPGWSAASAYLRGQILYRTAEMLEGRSEQFVAELEQQGVARRLAETEVTTSIERLVLWPVVWSAVRLLSSPELASVRKCAAPGCGWLFVDGTKNGSRRWCSMSVCGNRDKVRRYRRRTGG